jgi:hypothetical protein
VGEHRRGYEFAHERKRGALTERTLGGFSSANVNARGISLCWRQWAAHPRLVLIDVAMFD